MTPVSRCQPPETNDLEEILADIAEFEKLDSNKYTINTPSGQTVYWAAEQSGWCNRNCWGRSRSFRMAVVDSQKSEVLSMERPLR